MTTATTDIDIRAERQSRESWTAADVVLWEHAGNQLERISMELGELNQLTRLSDESGNQLERIVMEMCELNRLTRLADESVPGTDISAAS